jgi:hypothetical protein
VDVGRSVIVYNRLAPITQPPCQKLDCLVVDNSVKGAPGSCEPFVHRNIRELREKRNMLLENKAV